MKKTRPKLALRSETLRTLTDMELTRAAGGVNSDRVQCPVALDTGLVACATGTIVVATGTCD